MSLTALQVFDGAVPGLSEYTLAQKSLYIEMAEGIGHRVVYPYTNVSAHPYIAFHIFKERGDNIAS